MSALQSVGKLYSLDTLDTRFTTSSKSPPSHSDPVKASPNEARSSSTKKKTSPDALIEGASPSRWKTPEFLYHGLVFLFAVPLMFWTVYDVSKREWLALKVILQDEYQWVIDQVQPLIRDTKNIRIFYHQDGFLAVWSTTRISNTQDSGTMSPCYALL